MEETEMNWDFDFPEIKVSEDEDKISVLVDMPGVDEKDIEIEVKEDSLSVRVEKSSEKTTQDEGYFEHSEMKRFVGGSVVLPKKVIPELVEHEYKNGILKISLKKK